MRFRAGMSLTSCLARFDTTVGLLQSAPALGRVARELVRDCRLDGVRHLEVRLCPLLHTRGGLSAEGVVEAALAGLEEGGASLGTGHGPEWQSARLVLSVLEGMDEEEARTIVDLAIRFRDAGVSGVDLAGDESLFDARRVKRPFETARDHGLGVTVHAGEGHEATHVETAVLILCADRIGHGVSAASDARILDLLAARGVTIEVCLTSNVQTGAAASLEEHPLPRMLEAGVPVALATDNRFFSETTLGREYDLAAETLGIDRDGVERMVTASADAAFLPEADRLRLAELFRASLGPGPSSRPPFRPGSGGS